MMVRGGRIRSAPAIAALLLAAACGGAARPQVGPAPPPADPEALLQRDIDAILDAPALARSTWGVAIDSLAAGKRLYARNADKLLLPASNVKVITLAAAAERLGWAYSFTTEVFAAGPIDSGILDGDLVVVGGGDPSLDDWDGQASRVFTAWAEQLKSAGIRVVTGSVIGDDDSLPEATPGPGWAWDDLDRSFAAAPGALQFNQNTARLAVRPGDHVGDPAVLTLEPHGSGLTVRHQVKTSPREVAATLQTRRALGSPILDVTGSVPLGSAVLMRNVSVRDPTLYFVTALREALISAGVEVRGPPMDIDDLAQPLPWPADRWRVVSHASPPLSQLAVTMMKVSQNLFAESLLAASGGMTAVRPLIAAWGLPEGSVSVVDGSGLSRYNLATADALVRVLARIHRDEASCGAFMASLPIAGRDGTLEDRMRGTAAEGNARAKTGAFANARALSGFVTSADGAPLAFSLLANNFGTTADVIDAASDAIVIRLATFSSSSAR